MLYGVVVHVFFFFFQAEDGIRDKLVTGVQTCALPISRNDRSYGPSTASLKSAAFRKSGLRIPASPGWPASWLRRLAVIRSQTLLTQGNPGGSARAYDCRSEERRVGKECRSRWSPYH